VSDVDGLVRLLREVAGRRFVGPVDGYGCVELVFDDAGGGESGNLLTIFTEGEWRGLVALGFVSRELIDSGYADRADGLTDAEGVVMDSLAHAVEAFARLERQHPQELEEFVAGVHACQGLLATRVARRLFPDGWPVKG
jgi:hypothetical protein